jgi:hypothetical protein
MCHISVLPDDHINDDNPSETRVHEKARNPDDDDEAAPEDDSTFPEGEEIRGRDDMFLMFTEVDQNEKLEQNRIQLKLPFKHHAERMEQSTQMLTELDRSQTINTLWKPGNQSKPFMMVPSVQYCGRPKGLYTLSETLR